MTPIPLTADQIAELDEWNRDLDGATAALTCALNFHANRQAEIQKAQRKWWVAFALTHNLDLEAQKYTTAEQGARVVVIPLSDKPK